MRYLALIFSTFLTANFACAQDLPLPQQAPLPVFQGSGRAMEKPNAVIKPPAIGPIVVPQVTAREQEEQAIAEKERQIIDQMLRRKIAMAHATGKAGEIKRVILMNGPSDTLLSLSSTAPTAKAGKLELVGLEPNAAVSKQLDGFFGSPMTPESEQRLLETVRTQLTAANGKGGMPSVRLAGWWPEEGVIAVSVEHLAR